MEPGNSNDPRQPGAGHARALEALIDFYVGSGADAWIDMDPVDAFALSARPAPRAVSAAAPSAGQAAPHGTTADPGRGGHAIPGSVPLPSEPARPAGPQEPTHHAVMPDDEAVAAARELASNAPTLDALREAVAAFNGCNLKMSAKSFVFAQGRPGARVMFMGGAPRREDDREGLPFVGPAGRLFDRMLGAVGLSRDAVCVTNLVPWRPPGDRKASPQEVEICKPFALRQIELVAPAVLVFLGGDPANALTGHPDGILRLRGKWLDVPLAGRTMKALATFHPDHLLRNPEQKRYAWRDLLALQAALAQSASD
ncbi:uracil-DNA glycosylase [Stappia stellulata]|uniref:uracil-DNA glycosylase n=1 Tax=Stappia stellulata TaxID=71235 RepID=UPI000562B259|nr:uracil-DNA glycosylase [Stappia stellulata]